MNISRNIITQFLLEHIPHLQGIYLFGSYAQNMADKKSDVDIAVLTPAKLSLAEKNETAFLLSKRLNVSQVDLIDLKTASTVLQEEILYTGERIATQDEMACEKYEDYMARKALDFAIFCRPLVEDILARKSVYG